MEETHLSCRALKQPRPIDWPGLAADWVNVADEPESHASADNDTLNALTPAAAPLAESDITNDDLDDEIPF